MIRYRVRKVLELRDSVTGSPVVSSALRIFTSGALKRLDKGDGLVVLIDDGKGAGIPEKIRISGNIYLDAECRVDEHSGSSSQVCTIWLLPAPGYPVPAGIAAVKGKAAPGTRIEAVSMADREALKLAQDHEPGTGTIKLYHERGIDPMGKWYMASCKESSAAVFIGNAVDKKPDYTEYMVLEPAEGTVLKSSGTSFYPMMRTYADDKGEYLAAMPFVTAADTDLTMTFSDTDGAADRGDDGCRKHTLHMFPGEMLRIDDKEN
jgi:hypothetical protein